MILALSHFEWSPPSTLSSLSSLPSTGRAPQPTLSSKGQEPLPVIGTEKQSSRFLQITDIHLDMLYAEGAPVSAHCHFHERNKDRLSRMNNTTSMSAGPVAEPIGDHSCDSSFALVKQTLQQLGTIAAADVDFVVWTGDSGRYDRWGYCAACPEFVDPHEIH